MTTIRRATATDVPWLLTQLRAFADSYGTRRSLFPPDPAQAHAIAGALVAQHAFFIGERDGRPAGLIAGALVAHPYNPELQVLQELFWWVDPASRGSTLGSRLLATRSSISAARTARTGSR
jgi:N-acetylglutamate synthase-like GNAT family acetyltransferase